jgi:3-dehydroquinate synthetase
VVTIRSSASIPLIISSRPGRRGKRIPTTLVAQADSAVGGKNAINLDRGRNLAGTIHQPIAVISDIEVACGDAERGFKAGLAKIAKHTLISPSDLLGHLQGAAGRSSPVIQRLFGGCRPHCLPPAAYAGDRG